MKVKRKNGLLLAGLVLTLSTAVAGISYVVSANQNGLDETNSAIQEIIGDRYSFSTSNTIKQFKQIDILEKMYITNEASLKPFEYTTEKAYRAATYDSIITDDYSEEDYAEENADKKMFSLENIELKANESFTIKHLFNGNILENEDKELVITDHYASEGNNVVGINYESELAVSENGDYDFYLITSEDEIELIVKFVGSGTINYDFTSMSKNALTKKWRIDNEDPTKWNLDENGLTLSTTKGTLKPDVATSTEGLTNLFVTDLNYRNYTIETKINLDELLNTNFQQSGLMIYADDDNYLKLVYAYANGSSKIQFGYELEGTYHSVYQYAISTTSIWMKLVKTNTNYIAYISLDGFVDSNICIGNTNYEEGGDLALCAFHGTSDSTPSHDLTYDFVKITRN